MTREELERIANAKGFGTGAAARDRMAAEREAIDLLPSPSSLPVIEARGDDGRHLMPMAQFGNSSDDGKDWAIFHDGCGREWCCLGEDARDDARIVAAIVNAYRMGLIKR